MAKISAVGKVAGWADKASGYLLGFATTCTAIGIRVAMQQQLQDRGRLMLLLPAVLVTAWYGGVGPGLFALTLGVLLCGWLIIPPSNTINFGDRSEQLGIVVYIFVSIGIIALVHRERVAKKNREAAQEELERLNLMLEDRVRARTSELEVANRELELFCYNVSHDLRTPTRAIVGNIRILVEDFGDAIDAPIRLKLGRISRAAMKLSDQVDALLTYARLAKAGVENEAVDLSSLVSSEVRHLSKNLGVSVALDMPPEMTVHGDESQLRCAVSAIVTNAVVYSKSGQETKLTVEMDQVGDEAIISFKDEGIGFDMAYIHKVFEPFERLHRDDDYPGVGMGLANVARIAERHHGSVWAVSKLGEGATFYLRLGNQMSDVPKVPQLLSA